VKLSVPAHHLRAAVEWAAKHAPARPAMPSLAALTFATAGDSTLSIATTDYTLWATATAPATVHTGGEVVVSARLAADVVKALPSDGEVDLVATGAQLDVLCGRARARLPFLRGGAADPASEPAEFRHEVAGDDLARALDVSGRIAQRAAVQGIDMVHLDPRAGGLRVVGTDRFCLLMSDLPWTERQSEDGVPVNVPPSAARALAGLAKGAEVVRLALPSDLESGPSVLAARTRDRELVTRLGAVEFTPYARLLARRSTPRSVTVERTALVTLVKRVAALGEVEQDRGKRHVRLIPGGGAVEVTAGGWDESEHAAITDALDAEHDEEWNTDPWEHGLVVNAAYLVDVLDGFAADRVRLDMTTPRQPVLIHPADTDDQSVTALCMPVAR
jgi:DNA polymerase-3 subunit beta